MSASSGARRWLGSAATAIVAAMLAFAPGAVAATAPIYKCMDARLTLIYTDQRCADGEQLQIHPGKSDPEAAERLRRARDEIEGRAAVRIAEEQRVAAQKDLAAPARRARQEDRGPFGVAGGSAEDEAFAWYPAYLPAFHPTRMRHHRPHRAATPRRLSPLEPLFVPGS